MKVVSTFVQPVRSTQERVQALLLELGSVGVEQVQLFVFDTLVENKSLVIGVTVGQLNGPTIDDVAVSPVGQAVILCMNDHHALNYPSEPFMVAGVNGVHNAVQRVGQVLKKAPPKAAVLFVCANSKVYDKVASQLGIDYLSARQDVQ